MKPMLLLIDAGNTRVKWALAALHTGMDVPVSGHWLTSGSVAREAVSQLAHAWRTLDVTRVMLSNVAGAQMQEYLMQALADAFDLMRVCVEWFASVAVLAGIRNGYRMPSQLGCDRFAAVIGAHALFPDRHLIVATCGTATTIDAVTAQGDFLGGMILPGLGLMATSLAKNTAQLPQVVEHLVAIQPFADHTDAAIVSGCIAAQAGAIERAVVVHAAAMGANVECILAGGAASLIAPQLSIPYRKIDNLVLIGLHKVAIDHY
jgi:type III pantothenate kinase